MITFNLCIFNIYLFIYRLFIATDCPKYIDLIEFILWFFFLKNMTKEYFPMKGVYFRIKCVIEPSRTLESFHLQNGCANNAKNSEKIHALFYLLFGHYNMYYIYVSDF